MGIESLGYLGIRAKDPRAFAEFATRVLGMMPGESAGEARRFRLDELAWRFAVEQGDADDAAYIGLEVSGAPELEAMRARLREAGVAVGDGSADLLAERGVLGLISCKDPDGLAVEIFYGPTLRTETPFVSPAGVASFVTGTQGLGHVVLSTKDVVAARRFYQDLLGFRLSDTIRMQMGPQASFVMEFFHCNPRHHTIAFAKMPMMPKRLHHFMLQLESLDDVGATYDLCQARDVPIVMKLGKHTNDHMVSFYLRTPSGFNVEYGWGAREVDDSTWQVQVHTAGSIWGHQGGL